MKSVEKVKYTRPFVQRVSQERNSKRVVKDSLERAATN